MFEVLNPVDEQKTNLVNWYPILKLIRMRTPRTAIVYSGDIDLSPMVEGHKVENLNILLDRIKNELKNFNLPVFFRTGMLSNKHDWKNSCFLENEKDLEKHIANLVETSFMANIAGFPLDHNFWVIREMLETEPIFCSFPGDMPITKEYRFFINDGKIQCYHPYWPDEAFNLSEEDSKKLKKLQTLDKDEEEELKQMANYIARYFKGYWSVDFLKTKDGKWYCIDMATGDRSYHWPTCEHASKK